MSPITGRTDDMLIIRGVNVYPTQVADVLGRIEELSPHHQLVVSRKGTLDELEVRVELRTQAEGDTRIDALENRVALLIKDTIGCTAAVRVLDPGSVPRSDGGKLGRVRDLREL